MPTLPPLTGLGYVPPVGLLSSRIYQLQASAPITAGQVVAVSGSGTVAPAGASSTAVVGVAVDDAGTGQSCGVMVRGPVFSSTASGAITAGAQLIAAASGAVQTVGAGTAFQVLGVALDTVANGQAVRWILL